MDALTTFVTGEVTAIDLVGAAINLFVAFGCGLLLSTTYRRTYRGVSYSSTFDRSLITLSVITAIVIMVIGNNLARAFGLVGAMSIVRFRTALKDAQDLVFVFCSLAVGLASGVGLHLFAVMGTLFLTLILFVMAKTNFGLLGHREFVLQLAVAPPTGQDVATIYSPVLDRLCRTYRVLAARSGGGDAEIDLTFYVELAKDSDLPQLTHALGALPGVTRANVFYDEEPA
ncbi:MAG: DUF4956 domain-containing protein [Acidobacteriota bacterium]